MNNKKKTNKIKLILVIVLTLLVLLSGTFLVLFKMYINNTAAISQESQLIAFVVDEGETMDDIIENLYEKGLIANKTVTKIFVKLNKTNEYYAGNYILNKNMSHKELFAHIGDVDNCIQDEVECTILGGDWAKDIANKIAAVTNLTTEQLMNKWNDRDYCYSLINKYDFLTQDIFYSEHCYLEGYLFPETYRFFAETTVEQVTEKILDQLDEYYQENKQDFAKKNLSLNEIFTFASLVQYESGNPEDNPITASVFNNRLADDWRLELSSTVCYVMYTYNTWQECETQKNMDIDSPYNTYMYGGLPIGPICSPDKNALDATLHPAQTDYYFFVGANGKTYYARTLDEHYRNIERYLEY